MQQENDRLRAKRFQLELERGDRLQRIVDLEAEVHTLEENADAYEIERLMLHQNIADMQHPVEEAEVQVAALQAIVALKPLPSAQAHPEEQQGQSGWTKPVRRDRHCRPHQPRLRVVMIRWATRKPSHDTKKDYDPRVNFVGIGVTSFRSLPSCKVTAL
jgi:hypothetical protein